DLATGQAAATDDAVRADLRDEAHLRTGVVSEVFVLVAGARHVHGGVAAASGEGPEDPDGNAELAEQILNLHLVQVAPAPRVRVAAVGRGEVVDRGLGRIEYDHVGCFDRAGSRRIVEQSELRFRRGRVFEQVKHRGRFGEVDR